MISVRTAAARAGQLSPYTNRLFYLVVLGVSLTGAALAARTWLEWPAPFAFLAVGAVELGGVALSMHADKRRQIGEHALPARVLSAGVAAGAVAINYFGHLAHPFQAYFFAGMSALGYTVWLVDSSARRRDALRLAGKLGGTAPVYGLVAWVRHPGLTRRARTLALANENLGKVGSQAAALEAVRTERRSAAIATALQRRITKHVDPTMATIAVHTYDLDKIATRLAASADYDGLTAILAAELVPARLHTDTQAAELARAPLAFDHPAPIGPMPDTEATDLDVDLPISGTPPVDLTTVSKSAAVFYATAALGMSIPAPRIVDFLAEQGVTVSESLVRKCRRSLADATGQLPAWADPTGEQLMISAPVNGHRPTLTSVAA